MPLTLDDPTGIARMDRIARERRLRATCPPPRDPLARQQYERQLAEWLDTPESERDALGFGWFGRSDPSLEF